MDRVFVVVLVPLLCVVSCRALQLPAPQRTKGVGAECKLDTECRRGMACVDNACTPDASIAAGEKCDLTAGCAPGLYCATESKTCAPAGTGAVNEACETSADCTRGLYCGLSGLFPVCLEEGDNDIGGACTSASECLAGLGCLQGVCAAGAPTTVIPPFAGVDCAADSGAFRSYFEVPAANSTNSDFFKLSFPNEARNRGGAGIDLSGFPRPQSGPVGDMLARYIEAASLETGGFGTNQPLIMRFSAPLADSSLVYGATATSTPTVFLFKLVPKDPTKIGALDSEFGCYTQDFEDPATKQSPLWEVQTVGGVVEWLVIPTRTPFMCPNTFSFRPRTDNPLEPNTLYALALSTDVKSETGANLARDSDLEALLSATPPAAGDRLARPYACYAPARAAFANKQIPSGTSSVNLGALAIFRTQDPQAPVKAITKTMAAQAAPVMTALVKCSPGTPSPCASASDSSRACPAADNPLFDEYHGKLTVPVIQAGAKPYLVDGGYVEYTDGTSTRRIAKTNDNVVIQGSEDVCFALTVPKSGFSDPTKRAIVLYGHGTGGNFRSFTGEGQSDAQKRLIPGTDLASSLADGGSNPSLAVLSFDQPLHGPRAASPFPPDQLYFNVGNPRAMRDNALQAVSDYTRFVALMKALAAGNVQASGVDTTVLSTLQTSLAGSKRLFLGHSQGGINGALYIAAAPTSDIQGVLFSGTGGGLTQSLLNKAQPIDFRTRINAALQDTQTNQYHSVLGLFQMVGERSDPINFGRSMIGTAKSNHLILGLPGVPASSGETNPVPNTKALMHIIGFGDTYTPLRTSSDLWRSIGLGSQGAMPVFAANAAVEASGQIGGFETDTGSRGPLKRLDTDTGSAQGLHCNCTPTGVPWVQQPSNPPTSLTGACGVTSTTDAKKTTAGSIVYRPERDYDGHFVLFEHPDARRQAKAFLQTSAASAAGMCSASPIAIPGN